MRNALRRQRKLAAAALAAAALACQKQPAERPAIDSEVQDIAPPPDAALSTAQDEQATAAAPAFSGVLPEDYPKDAPPYVPSTLVDFGPRFVVFQTPDALAAVRSRFTAALASRGWRGDGTLGKDGRTLRVSFEHARPGTRIRVEY